MRTFKFEVEKAGVKSYEEYPILIEGGLLLLKRGYSNGVPNGGEGAAYEYDSRLEVVLPEGNPLMEMSFNSIFALSKDYDVVNISTSNLVTEDGSPTRATFDLSLSGSMLILRTTNLPPRGRVVGSFTLRLQNKKDSSVTVTKDFNIHIL